MKADLHLHSTASDGTLEPDELVALAAEMGFTHLALTDHDSVEGISRAQDAGARLRRDADPPAWSCSCGAQKEIHILGYGLILTTSECWNFAACARWSGRRARRRWCVNCVKTARRFRWIV